MNVQICSIMLTDMKSTVYYNHHWLNSTFKPESLMNSSLRPWLGGIREQYSSESLFMGIKLAFTEVLHGSRARTHSICIGNAFVQCPGTQAWGTFPWQIQDNSPLLFTTHKVFILSQDLNKTSQNTDSFGGIVVLLFFPGGYISL